MTLPTRDALDALGSLWTCGALWSGLTLGVWVPHAAGVHLCHRGAASEWTMAFAGLWRVTESPSIARYLDSGKGRKRVLGVHRRSEGTDLCWHDLRRTAGCRWLQRDGKSMEEVSILLGHTSVKITAELYAFLRSEDVAESLSGRTIPGTGTAV